MKILRFLCILALSNSLATNLQAQEDLAVVNEVVISSNPVHENVAEKYVRAATGEKNSITTDTSDSAFKIFVPLVDNIPEGTVVDHEKADDACDKLKSYLRKLRQNNNQRKASGENPKLIYNFQCSANHIYSISATTNDPALNTLWGLSQINNIDMDVPEAWNKTTGSNEVVIAVIDTGIDYNHPDLAANMWKNLPELNGRPGADDDNNGVVDDIYGYNSIENSGNPMDDHYHGTHCAGTIGAVGNNSAGIVGVAQKVKMMGVKFLSSTGSGSLMDAVKSIDYVTNQKIAGVNIIASNNSWGGGPFVTALYDAITRASNNNILFVAAAGNNTQNIDQQPSYPASYDVPNIISVGAIGADGSLAYFSNYGANNVDVVAPGVSINSTAPNNTYKYLSGTSMATPHITGAIALLKSYSATMNMTTVRDIVFSSGKQITAALGKSKYGIMPTALGMLLEADRRGLGGIIPSPAPSPTPRATATATATPTATATATATPTTAPGYWNIKGFADSAGKKLALAKVILKANGQTFVTYTDAQGNYSFNNIYGPAEYTLEVLSAGQQFSIKNGNLTNHTNSNFFGTTKNYKLTAKVIDQNGQGKAGVVVGESSSGGKITNSDGVVEFILPYGGEYKLSADSSSDDFLDSELEGVIKGDVTRVFVVLPDSR